VFENGETVVDIGAKRACREEHYDVAGFQENIGIEYRKQGM